MNSEAFLLTFCRWKCQLSSHLLKSLPFYLFSLYLRSLIILMILWSFSWFTCSFQFIIFSFINLTLSVISQFPLAILFFTLFHSIPIALNIVRKIFFMYFQTTQIWICQYKSYYSFIYLHFTFYWYIFLKMLFLRILTFLLLYTTCVLHFSIISPLLFRLLFLLNWICL